MGQKVLIIGQSGTGKSTSMRNFAKDEVCLIKSINKQLPFRGKFEDTFVSDKVSEIIRRMKSTDKKVIVIDDAQYVMGNEFFRRAQEQSWQKFTDIGKNFYDLLSATDDLPEDVIVYFLLHTEKDSDGNIKVKTIGKMLDEKLTVEGTATIVLMTNVIDGVYTFQTQNSGKDICKSPMGMFNNFLIDNDLKMVDGIIREFYELSDEVIEEKGVLAEKPTRGSRRSTRIAAEAIATESVKQLAGVEDYKPSNDTVPPTEETPKRRERKKINDGLTDEQREAFKAEMREKNKEYLAEKAQDEAKLKKDVTDMSDTEVVTPAKEVVEEPKRSRKTLAEKLAEGGFNMPEPIETADATPTRRRRRTVGE